MRSDHRMLLQPVAVVAFVLALAAPAGAADLIPDEGCGYGCDGRAAGYAFAERNNITDPYDCEGHGSAFFAGCASFVEQRRSSQPWGAPIPGNQYAQPYGQRTQGQKDRQRDEAAGDDKGPGLAHADLARGDRARGSARDLGVDVAVDDVVVGAARRTHQGRAPEELEEQPKVRAAADHGAGQRDGLPAWQHQQPNPGRPVEAAEPEPGAERRRRAPIDPVRGGGVGQRRGLAHRRELAEGAGGLKTLRFNPQSRRMRN